MSETGQNAKSSLRANVFRCSSSSRHSSRRLEGVAHHLDDDGVRPGLARHIARPVEDGGFDFETPRDDDGMIA